MLVKIGCIKVTRFFFLFWFFHKHINAQQHPPAHSPAHCSSTQETDRPSLLLTPRPDMQFISCKTCRSAKDGRTSYRVWLHKPLLSMLCLGSFHPPADSRPCMGPSVKDPRHSCSQSLHLCPSPLPEGEIRVTGPTGWDIMMHLARVHVHDSVTFITTVHSCVKAGFVHHFRCCRYLPCSTSVADVSPRRERASGC